MKAEQPIERFGTGEPGWSETIQPYGDEHVKVGKSEWEEKWGDPRMSADGT